MSYDYRTLYLFSAVGLARWNTESLFQGHTESVTAINSVLALMLLFHAVASDTWFAYITSSSKA